MKKTVSCLFALFIAMLWGLFPTGCQPKQQGTPPSETSDLEILDSIALDAVPLDVAVSEDGRLLYVLTNAARIDIYSRDRELQASVAVPAGSRRIAAGPGDDVLLVTNTVKKALQIVRVNMEYTFTSDNSPTRGPSDAPVTLTLFTDFECSYCAQLAPVLDEVHRAYPRDVRIVFKNFPLRIHRFAVQAALAALAAEDQGQFWPFHDLLYEDFSNINPQRIEEIREELGLDAERFRARMNDPALKDLIRRDIEEGNAAGVRGTPTVFINGKEFRGERSLDGFREAIEAVLNPSPQAKGD